MKHIPEDVVEEILLRLPCKSLARFKCVSKSWCAMIRGRSFINKRFDRIARITGSCIYSRWTWEEVCRPLSPSKTIHQQKKKVSRSNSTRRKKKVSRR